MDSNIIGPATLSLTQAITAFSLFLPKISDVRKADARTDMEFVGDVRIGEVAAVTLSVGLGAMVSSLTGSPVPAITAGIMALILVCLYESTLRANRPMEPRTNLRSAHA